MNPPNKKWIWNIIISLACLMLLGTAFIGIRRMMTANAYQQLEQQREVQKVKNEVPSVPSALPAPRIKSEDDVIKDVPDTNSKKIPAAMAAQNQTWLSINPDFSGWLDIPGTRIEYPFVRSRDNQDYLKKDFYGNYSDAGTLFLDQRSIGNFKDRHTIIYGHNMKNRTMFHDLVYYHDRSFYEKHPFIKVSGLFEEKTYRIFSVYEISATDYEFQLHFKDDEEYMTYLKQISKQSLYEVEGLSADKEPGLLTLVTCSYGTENGRTIIHAIEWPQES